MANLFDLNETAVMEVFEVAEFESVLEMEMAQFFVGQGTIFARNLIITGSYGLGDVSIVFFIKFYIRIGHIC